MQSGPAAISAHLQTRLVGSVFEDVLKRLILLSGVFFVLSKLIDPLVEGWDGNLPIASLEIPVSHHRDHHR